MKFWNNIVAFLMASVVLVFILCVVSGAGCEFVCQKIVHLVFVCLGVTIASASILWLMQKQLLPSKKSENQFALKILYNLDVSLLLLLLSSSWLGQILDYNKGVLPSFVRPVLVVTLCFFVFVTLFLLRNDKVVEQGDGEDCSRRMLGKVENELQSQKEMIKKIEAGVRDLQVNLKDGEVRPSCECCSIGSFLKKLFNKLFKRKPKKSDDQPKDPAQDKK